MKKIFDYLGEIYQKTDLMGEDYFERVYNEVEWSQDEITLFGKKHLLPRLQSFQAENGIKYSYSGAQLVSRQWSPNIFKIKKQIEKLSGLVFNSALINLYRDSSDSNGWHSDNEKELGHDPQIASYSIGGTRKFQIKKNTETRLYKTFELRNDELIIMHGEFQKFWKHQIPKSKKVTDPRINITFRKIESKYI